MFHTAGCIFLDGRYYAPYPRSTVIDELRRIVEGPKGIDRGPAHGVGAPSESGRVSERRSSGHRERVPDLRNSETDRDGSRRKQRGIPSRENSTDRRKKLQSGYPIGRRLPDDPREQAPWNGPRRLSSDRSTEASSSRHESAQPANHKRCSVEEQVEGLRAEDMLKRRVDDGRSRKRGGSVGQKGYGLEASKHASRGESSPNRSSLRYAGRESCEEQGSAGSGEGLNGHEGMLQHSTDWKSPSIPKDGEGEQLNGILASRLAVVEGGGDLRHILDRKSRSRNLNDRKAGEDLAISQSGLSIDRLVSECESDFEKQLLTGRNRSDSDRIMEKDVEEPRHHSRHRGSGYHKHDRGKSKLKDHCGRKLHNCRKERLGSGVDAENVLGKRRHTVSPALVASERAPDLRVTVVARPDANMGHASLVYEESQVFSSVCLPENQEYVKERVSRERDLHAGGSHSDRQDCSSHNGSHDCRVENARPHDSTQQCSPGLEPQESIIVNEPMNKSSRVTKDAPIHMKNPGSNQLQDLQRETVDGKIPQPLLDPHGPILNKISTPTPCVSAPENSQVSTGESLNNQVFNGSKPIPHEDEESLVVSTNASPVTDDDLVDGSSVDAFRVPDEDGIELDMDPIEILDYDEDFE